MYKVAVNKKEHQISYNKNSDKSGTIDGVDFSFDIVEISKNCYHMIKDNKSYNIELVKIDFENKSFVVKVNNEKHELKVYDEFDLLLKKMGYKDELDKKVNNILAPMPGLVLDILVEKGSKINKDDNILVLEAMKMENILKSPIDGIVKNINCKKNSTVNKNQILIEFE